MRLDVFIAVEEEAPVHSHAHRLVGCDPEPVLAGGKPDEVVLHADVVFFEIVEAGKPLLQRGKDIVVYQFALGAARLEIVFNRNFAESSSPVRRRKDARVEKCQRENYQSGLPVWEMHITFAS